MNFNVCIQIDNLLFFHLKSSKGQSFYKPGICSSEK